MVGKHNILALVKWVKLLNQLKIIKFYHHGRKIKSTFYFRIDHLQIIKLYILYLRKE